MMGGKKQGHLSVVCAIWAGGLQVLLIIFFLMRIIFLIPKIIFFDP